jgi:hypothetical protein
MTEHLEIRAPLAEVRIAIACKACGAELVVNPADERQRLAVASVRTCSICEVDLDSGAVQALWHVAQAVELAKHRPASVSVVLRRDGAPRAGGPKER